VRAFTGAGVPQRRAAAAVPCRIEPQIGVNDQTTGSRRQFITAIVAPFLLGRWWWR